MQFTIVSQTNSRIRSPRGRTIKDGAISHGNRGHDEQLGHVRVESKVTDCNLNDETIQDRPASLVRIPVAMSPIAATLEIQKSLFRNVAALVRGEILHEHELNASRMIGVTIEGDRIASNSLGQFLELMKLRRVGHKWT